MVVCKYCDRIFKEKVNVCPGCGGKSFSNKAFSSEIVIETPPKGGYLLDDSVYDHKIRYLNFIIFITVFFTLFLSIFLFSIAYLIFFIGIIILFFSYRKKNIIMDDWKKLDILSQKGVLIKGISYEIVETGASLFGQKQKSYKVIYKESNGVETPLCQRVIHSEEMEKSDTVDLLIDPEDSSNYFIDLEIY